LAVEDRELGCINCGFLAFRIQPTLTQRYTATEREQTRLNATLFVMLSGFSGELSPLITVWLQVAELRSLGTGRSKLLRRIVKFSFQPHIGSTQSFSDC
jgi:hypothetical protein